MESAMKCMPKAGQRQSESGTAEVRTTEAHYCVCGGRAQQPAGPHDVRANWPRQNWAKRWAVAPLFCLLVCCGPKPPRSIDEAGTVRVSIASVGHWSDYKEALQPTFTLTEDAALEQVVPVTQMQEEKRIRGTGIGVSAALPTITSTSVVNTLPDGSPALEDPGLTTVTQKSGDASTLKPEVKTLGTRTATGLAAFDPTSVAPARTDPMMRYWAATALVQEVRLLNRYMRDAAVHREYDAYVVRFNVGLMPRRRDLGFDAYLNLGFFVGEEAECETVLHGTKSDERCAIAEVLPLMVLDNLEAASQSLSNDQVFALALAASGTLNAVGANANLDSMHEDFRRVLGRDLNSLLMVTRLASNTLRVRFGASQEAKDDFVMVPRNHFVTAVVMTPRLSTDIAKSTSRRLHVWTDVEFVDVKTGKALAQKSKEMDDADVALLADRYEHYGVKPSNIQAAWQVVLVGNWPEFLRKFSRTTLDVHTARELWLDIAQLQTGYSFDALSVDLPPRPSVALFPSQQVLLLDDGKEATTARLTGGSALNANELCATLETGPADRVKRLVARKVTLFNRDTTAEFEFPSLKTWGMTDGPLNLRVRADADKPPCSTIPVGNDAKEATYVAQHHTALAEPKPPCDLRGVTGVIIARAGKGMLRFELGRQAAAPALLAVKVSVTGADVTTIVPSFRATGASAVVPGGAGLSTPVGSEFEVKLPGSHATMLTLTLENLKSPGTVKIAVTSTGTATVTKEVQVEAAVK